MRKAFGLDFGFSAACIIIGPRAALAEEPASLTPGNSRHHLLVAGQPKNRLRHIPVDPARRVHASGQT
jgi:hypothetical protein